MVVLGIVSGAYAASWIYVVGIAVAGTALFLLLRTEVKSTLFPIEKIGPVIMFALQLLNALALYGVGYFARWLIVQ